MPYIFILAPIIGWLASGIMKFTVNYVRFRKEAVNLIGNGGFPSTHTTIVTSIVMLIGFTQGFNTPIFGLGTGMLFITVIDAIGIRRTVGRQAGIINKHILKDLAEKNLRERQGHNAIEVFGGLVLGSFVAFILSKAGSF